MAAMGTNGDMLPLFWAATGLAIKEGVTVHFVVQPLQMKTVKEKLNGSLCFTASEAEEKISVTCKAFQVSFTPPNNAPPVVEIAATAEVEVSVHLCHLVFQTDSDSDVKFHVWAPLDEFWNETVYQDWQNLDKTAVKLPEYGDFLTRWQAALSSWAQSDQ